MSLFMLAQIRRLKGKITIGLVLLAGFGMVSCATQKQHVALVDDPDAKGESQMPWNKQEKWEQGGQLSAVSDRR
jgi:hypothetical protein